jgi:hypothetical protein
MRIGLAAGRLDRTGSKVLIAPGGAPREIPGPWRLAAVIRISDAEGSEAASPHGSTDARPSDEERERGR